MGFKNLDLDITYRSSDNNMVEDFYIPVLKFAVLYKRAVGFFSSTSLIEMSKGISKLIENNGKIQIITSPKLSEEDIEAINKGYLEREKVIEKVILKEIKKPKNSYEAERFNYIAKLISNNQLDIKIAFILDGKNSIGMYHEKIGIIYDDEGDKIAFTGSMNESDNSFNNNFESIDVYSSWKENKRVLKKEQNFNDLWINETKGIKVIDFPEIAKEKLKQFVKRDVFDEILLDDIYKTKMKNIPKTPLNIKFYEYQISAINEWKRNKFRGVFDMATGTGKTFTGLGAIDKIVQEISINIAVFIVCPYQHLVEQWVEDIINFNMNPIIGYSASPQKDWKKKLKNAVRDQELDVKNRNFFCFVCTNATFSSNFVQNQINDLLGPALLVVDEAHNFGATNLSKLLTDNFKYRLALSATLERHNDEEGTEKLMSYFEEKCIEYPLERAIEEKKLTRYKYFPIIVNFNNYEQEKYKELTSEMVKCFMWNNKEKGKLSTRGKMLALARARLVAGAEDKITKLKEYIKPYIRDKHILVYCGAAKLLNSNMDYTLTDDEDLRQIDIVTNLLGNKLEMKVSQFTSKENIDERKILKKEFSNGDNLQALIAIKCLDEGVNIPKIKVTFILASTTNPKEYIQRRGRVLRLSEGKEYAEIYDFITLPRPLDQVHSLTLVELNQELSLVKNELCRAKEFARIAMNKPSAEAVLDKIKEAYNINDYSFTFEEEV